ncbi:MAG: hypothetical protein AAGC46_00670 [Solirubrobacteraceae bacterium]|nr:hypothetical protein [Patulibacter sp.]
MATPDATTAPLTGAAAPTAATTETSRRRRGRPSPEIGAGLLAAAVLLVWCVVMYWPVPLHLATWQAGGPGDGWSGTAIWRALADEHLNPFAAGAIHAYNAPEGLPVTYQVNIQQWPTTIFYYLFARLGDADVGQTFYMTTGYVLTAGSMAWFLRRFVVRDSWIAVLLGCALALQPLSVIKGPGHTAFVHLWPIVFTIAAVLVMRETPTVRKSVVAGLWAFLTVSWSGYHLLLGGTAFAVVLLGTQVIAPRGAFKLALRNTIIAGGTLLAGLLVLAVWLKLASHGVDPTDAVRQNPLINITIYGARLHEYLVPPTGSTIFGHVTAPYFASRWHLSNPSEFSIYLGNILLGLAVAGFVVGVLLRRRAEAEPREWRRPIMARGTIVVAGAAVMIVAVASSLPPTISVFGLTLPMPSHAFYDVLKTWRVYSRFALVAAIGMLVMSAIGLAWLAGSGRRRVVVLALATILIPLDLSVHVGDPASTAPPQIAAAIRALPPGTLAVYPLERGEADGYGAIYHQAAYGRDVLNGFDDQPTETRAGSINDLSDPGTIDRLNALHVRYVLAVPRPIAPGDGTPPVPATLPKGYEVVATGNYGAYPSLVYEVPQRSGKVLVSPGRTFSNYPGGAAGTAWGQSSQPTVLLDGDCDGVCDGTLELGLTAFHGAHEVTVKQNDHAIPVTVGGVTKTGPVPLTSTAAQTLSIHVRFRNTATLVLSTDAKPEPVTVIDPASTDPRLLTIGITTSRWTSSGSTDVSPAPPAG